MNLTPYGYGDRETWGGLSPEPDRKAERLIEDFYTAITDKDGDERQTVMEALFDTEQGQRWVDDITITALLYANGKSTAEQMLETAKKFGDYLDTLTAEQAVIFAQK